MNSSLCLVLGFSDGIQADGDEGPVLELVAKGSWWWRAGETTQPSAVGGARGRVSEGRQQPLHGWLRMPGEGA